MTYAIAALITMHTTPRQQVLWLIGILIGYWAAMMLIPIPGIGRGLLTPEGNLAAFMDRNLLPGQIRGGLYDRLGLYSTLPAVSTVLIGVLAGHWLLNLQSSPMRKVAGLLGAFGGCWAAGLAVAQYIPINTKFWSPSYVLSAGAWSLFILAVFYLIIDVWRFRKLAFFFVVIGMNSITIYCLQSPVDFKDIADFFFAGVLALASPAVQTVLLATATLLVKWCLLLFLYRHRIFLRA